MKNADPKSAHEITAKTDGIWNRWYQIGVVLGVSIDKLEGILQTCKDDQDGFKVSRLLTTILMYYFY